MSLADGLVIWVHLVGASIWVGGSIFLGIVLVPVLKSHTKTLEEMVALMVKIGRRFNKITVPAFAAFVAYIVHIRLLDADMERKIMSGQGGNIYVQSVRTKIIILGEIIVVLSVAILLLAALLDSGI
jgi:uncharacterized membrane protein